MLASLMNCRVQTCPCCYHTHHDAPLGRSGIICLRDEIERQIKLWEGAEGVTCLIEPFELQVAFQVQRRLNHPNSRNNQKLVLCLCSRTPQWKEYCPTLLSHQMPGVSHHPLTTKSSHLHAFPHLIHYEWTGFDINLLRKAALFCAIVVWLPMRLCSHSLDIHFQQECRAIQIVCTVC